MIEHGCFYEGEMDNFEDYLNYLNLGGPSKQKKIAKRQQKAIEEIEEDFIEILL